MQSAGTPPAVPAPRVDNAGTGPAAGSSRLTISWDGGAPQRSAADQVHRLREPQRWRVGRDRHHVARPAQSLGHTTVYDGASYRYVVTATNGADIEGPKANPTRVLVDRHPRGAGPSQRHHARPQPSTPPCGSRWATPGPARSPSSSGAAATAAPARSPAVARRARSAVRPSRDMGTDHRRPSRCGPSTAPTGRLVAGAATPTGPTATPPTRRLPGQPQWQHITWRGPTSTNGRPIEPGAGTTAAVNGTAGAIEAGRRAPAAQGQTYRLEVRAQLGRGLVRLDRLRVASSHPRPDTRRQRQQGSAGAVRRRDVLRAGRAVLEGGRRDRELPAGLDLERAVLEHQRRQLRLQRAT